MQIVDIPRLVAAFSVCASLSFSGIAPALAAGTSHNTDWRYYGNSLSGDRYIDSTSIDASNIKNLKPVWIFHTGIKTKKTSFESQPLEVGGTLYVTSPEAHVFALDAVTGKLKWSYTPQGTPPLSKLAICCGVTNRGVAYGDGNVYVAQLGGKLVALDAATGKVRWSAQAADWHKKEVETMAPQFVDGKVIVGVSGGEMEIRGFVTAFDAKTGKKLWRFYTTAGPGDPHASTWAGDSYAHGGGPVWTTPNADPKLGLLYITVGNAAPDVNGSQRAGKDLYTDSIVALDLNSGKMRWYFQEVHHDIWDYDSIQPTQLYDVVKDGKTIPVIANADKDGYYFILDRRTGAPVSPVHEESVSTSPSWQHPWPTQPVSSISLEPHSVHTQASAVKPKAYSTGSTFTPPGNGRTLIQPGFETGPEWGPGAYSPQTHYAYIPSGGYEPWVYHAQPGVVNSLGSTGSPAHAHGFTYGLLDAVNTNTDKIAWRFKMPNKSESGTLVSGNVVFFGQSNGTFRALDARSGKSLWSWSSNGPGIGGANGAPAAYVRNGREYVVMAFGGNRRDRKDNSTDAGKLGDALVAFALDGNTNGSPSVVYANVKPLNEGAPQSITAQSSAPSGAHVVTLKVHDMNFYPSHFAVQAGQRVAVHLEDTGIKGANIVMHLANGKALSLKQDLKPGKSAYFVFTAPQQPGTYAFSLPGDGAFIGGQGAMNVTH